MQNLFLQTHSPSKKDKICVCMYAIKQFLGNLIFVDKNEIKLSRCFLFRYF